MRRGVGVAILLATVPSVARAQSERIMKLNRDFAGHVRNLSAGRGAEAETILRSLTKDYVGEDAEAFVPDSLGLLYPKFQGPTQPTALVLRSRQRPPAPPEPSWRMGVAGHLRCCSSSAVSGEMLRHRLLLAPRS